MCCNSNCKGCMCLTGKISKWLLIIGGLNWGLVGVGMLLNSMSSWNLVYMIFGSMPMIESIVYILVGASAVMYLIGCKCKKCSGGTCCVESKPGAQGGAQM
jgi:hypothetical protein